MAKWVTSRAGEGWGGLYGSVAGRVKSRTGYVGE